MWYVYFLKSLKKNWYYVGSTNRLEERVREHNTGKVPSTKPYLPLELVYSFNFSNEKDARKFERKVKAKRIEKERIIGIIEKQ